MNMNPQTPEQEEAAALKAATDAGKTTVKSFQLIFDAIKPTRARVREVAREIMAGFERFDTIYRDKLSREPEPAKGGRYRAYREFQEGEARKYAEKESNFFQTLARLEQWSPAFALYVSEEGPEVEALKRGIGGMNKERQDECRNLVLMAKHITRLHTAHIDAQVQATEEVRATWKEQGLTEEQIYNSSGFLMDVTTRRAEIVGSPYPDNTAYEHAVELASFVASIFSGPEEEWGSGDDLTILSEEPRLVDLIAEIFSTCSDICIEPVITGQTLAYGAKWVSETPYGPQTRFFSESYPMSIRAAYMRVIEQEKEAAKQYAEYLLTGAVPEGRPLMHWIRYALTEAIKAEDRPKVAEIARNHAGFMVKMYGTADTKELLTRFELDRGLMGEPDLFNTAAASTILTKILETCSDVRLTPQIVGNLVLFRVEWISNKTPFGPQVRFLIEPLPESPRQAYLAILKIEEETARDYEEINAGGRISNIGSPVMVWVLTAMKKAEDTRDRAALVKILEDHPALIDRMFGEGESESILRRFDNMIAEGSTDAEAG